MIGCVASAASSKSLIVQTRSATPSATAGDALTGGAETSNLGRYLARNPLIKNDLSGGPIRFQIPGLPTVALGSEASLAGFRCAPRPTRLARIDGVQLFSRIDDWTSDAVKGYPVEVCRYGQDDEPEIVIVKRFPAGTDESEALRQMVSEQRAIAAIEAVRRHS